MKQKTTFKAAAAINDHWRSWIAENLLLGVHPTAITGVLAQCVMRPISSDTNQAS